MSNALPKNNVVLRFPPTPEVVPGGGDEEEETYQLLELPAEILKQVEALKDKGDDAVFPLTIKGRPSDDATLCTPNSTFLLRTVGISNSLLVCRTPSSMTAQSPEESDDDDDEPLRPTLQIRDVCHQILECVPVAPNLERIRGILRDSAWEGIGESSLGKRKREGECKAGGKKGKDKKWTREQLRSVVQASEAELEKGLRERNVVEVDGRMLLLPPPQLKELLTILLSLLAIFGSHKTGKPIAPRREIIEGLEDHEVPSSLATAVMELFGELDDEKWTADAQAMVREVGRGLLCKVRGETGLREFLVKWRGEVGEMWTDDVDIKLLEGDYLISPAPPTTLSSSTKPSKTLSYFPLSQLPTQPALRFADLFITRPRWRPDEMAPFLKGLTRDGDTKERDKLVVKFVRVVKEKEGVWWYPRRTA
ncbi:hypothetical protein IAT38_007222 [Cryptococcus sp. DSM 104549]